MILIADSSALIALSIADGLHLLDAMFGEVLVPEAVFNECTHKGKPQASELENYLSGKVRNVDTSQQIRLNALADLGETEAMILYKQLSADRLLIDDKNARRIAKLNDINTIGSIGILLAAKERGLIAAIRPMLDAVMQPPLYMGRALYQQALTLAGE
jgi:uncharacterized protein